MRSAVLVASVMMLSFAVNAHAANVPETSSTDVDQNTEQPGDAIQIAVPDRNLALLVESTLPDEDKKFGSSVISALSESDPEDGIRKMMAVRTQLGGPSIVDSLLGVRIAKYHVALGRNEAAARLYEELIRDYPDLPGPRQRAIRSLAYTDQAVTAARIWIDFAASQPRAAKRIDGYTFGALASNLAALRQSDTRNALFIALDRIGYDPGSNTRRNQLYMGLFENAAADRNRTEEARSSLAKIENNELLRTILSDRRYRRFWNEIETSPTSWRIRTSRWVDALALDSSNGGDGVVTNRFFEAVRHYSGPTRLISTYEPELLRVFESDKAPNRVHNYVFWASSLADAHLMEQNFERADQLLRKSWHFFEEMDGVNSTNVSANHARLLNLQGKHAEALALIEPAIGRLEARQTALVALAQMHAVRIEALYSLGRLDEGLDSIAALENSRAQLLATYAQTMLKIDRFEDARNAVRTGLRSRSYQQALRFLQRPMGMYQNDETRHNERLIEGLRNDPSIKEALARKGRIVEIEPIEISEPTLPEISY